MVLCIKGTNNLSDSLFTAKYSKLGSIQINWLTFKCTVKGLFDKESISHNGIFNVINIID